MEPVVRVGDTVRRVAGPWTPAVHEFLRLCATARIPYTPRPFGLDGEGREIVSFIPGVTLSDAPPEIRWSRDILRESAVLLRRIHDASIPLVSTDLAWRQPSHPPIEVICHNDFATYNLICRDGELSGAIDFDMASPGSRLWDFAYLAYRIVPFVEDAVAFDPTRDGDRDERLLDLIAAYGAEWTPSEVTRMIAHRLEELALFTDRRARETGRSDFIEHAALYRRDVERMRRRRRREK